MSVEKREFSMRGRGGEKVVTAETVSGGAGKVRWVNCRLRKFGVRMVVDKWVDLARF